MDVSNLVDGFPERFSPDELRRGGWSAPDHFARYLFAAHFVAGRSVADLCCGAGYGSNLLLASGALRVKGIDIDANTISVAQRDYAGPDFATGRADGALDLTGFDMRVCFEGIEHVTDSEQLLANMRGADLALISTPNADLFDNGFSGNPHHVREWTRDEFAAMLSRHFSDVRMYCQWFHPSPFDQDWSVGSAAKAIAPVSVKAWLRRVGAATKAVVPGMERAVRSPPTATSTQPLNRAIPWDHRVYPTGYLSVVPPGLRYGKPHTWLAVCRS